MIDSRSLAQKRRKAALVPRRRKKDHEPEPTDAVSRAQEQVAEVFANISEFWGFTRTQGRVFGLVFMSPEPLDHRTVRERLDISAGSASMTLTSLVEWGVLHRDGRLYVAETNFWKLITFVLKQRESDLIHDSIGRAKAVAELLAHAVTTSAPASPASASVTCSSSSRWAAACSRPCSSATRSAESSTP